MTVDSTGVLASANAPVAEFANMSLVSENGAQYINFGSPEMDVQVAPITLGTGGSAVVVIESFFNPTSVASDCLSAPGDSVLEGDFPLSSGDLGVPIPLMPAPGGGSENANGSSFYECATSAVSPFVTWNEATEMVGNGSIFGDSQGTLPGADNQILSLAP
jgi:hypothetical protein